VTKKILADDLSIVQAHCDDEYTTLLTTDPLNPQYVDLKLVAIEVDSMRDQGWGVLWQEICSSHVFTVLGRRRTR